MRPRILKLGWEFPPMINGGLGVACFGLSQALAKLVDLRVVVPKAEAQFEGFELLGLNQVRPEDLAPAEKHYRYESFAEIVRVPVRLDPYASGETIIGETKPGRRKIVEFSHTSDEQLGRFEIGDLYGSDLGSKVVEYSKIAAKLALQSEFDLVHAHDWMTFLAGIEVKKATGRPLVVHLHASQYDRAGADARDWIYDIERVGMEQADRVIPVSCYTGEIIAGHYGIERAKIRPVHNGVELVEPFVTRKKFPEKLVLFLGRLTAQKGPEFFLEIAAKVLERQPGVRFVMAGSGEKMKLLVESGAFHGLGGNFHFTGFLDKRRVNELLSMADVYCMPSVSEPFGLSALEAAQFGVPAVISRQSGVAEVLKGALTADFSDVGRMAGHICDLLEDEGLRGRVIRRMRKDLGATTWDAAAEKVVAIYRELL